MQETPSIHLTPRAITYIRSKNAQQLTLELKPLYSCCVPYTPPPHISLTPPDSTHAFFTRTLEGITIYIDHALCDVEQLTVDKHGFGIFSWLSVVDWRPLPK